MIRSRILPALLALTSLVSSPALPIPHAEGSETLGASHAAQLVPPQANDRITLAAQEQHAASGPHYPLIGWQMFGGAVQDFYARFDLLIGRNNNADWARQMKGLNPNIRLIYTTDWNTGCELDPLPSEWILRNADGSPFDSGYGVMTNPSDLARPASSGKHAGKTFLQACAEHMSSIDFSLFDGVATDGLWGRSEMWWMYKHSEWSKIDIDHNGVSDHTEHTEEWFLDHWQAGIDQMLAEMRSRIDAKASGKVIVINSGSSHTWGWPWTNGYIIEKARGNWDPNFNQDYVRRFRAASVPPFTSVADGLPNIDNPLMASVPTGESRDLLPEMRHGLVLAMFQDMYFSFQDSDEGNPHSKDGYGNSASQEHYWSFWYDEFEADLGMPTGSTTELRAGLWYRCFDKGIALANPDGRDKTVTAADLGGLCGYSGPYYRLRAGQDLALQNLDSQWSPLHDGSQLTSATLRGVRIPSGGLELMVGDGLLLFRAPTTVVSDILIDNNYMSTSPTNDWMQTGGFTQEQDCRAGSSYYTVRCAWNKDSFAFAWARPGSAQAVFRANVGVAGLYEVFEWHGTLAEGAVASQAPYLITSAEGTKTVTVDQTANAGRWNSLGAYRFDRGRTGQVVISAQGADGTVLADAIKFVYRGEADGSIFADVPSSHWARGAIEALYNAGFVAGCQASPLLYCPERGLTRAEMAVFVVRGVHGASYQPPQPTEQVFADVPLEQWFADWTDRLWRDRYTAGCGTAPLTFCPNAQHTRAESTVYFSRMLQGPDYVPAEPSLTVYDDVALGTWHAKWVNAAYQAQLLQECEPPPDRGDRLFHPMRNLTRAEAACIMAKAKGLAAP